MMIFVVDAHERRCVSTGGIPGVYVYAHMRDCVIIKFTRPSVGILCDINEKYEEYVIEENGERVLYLRLNKTLYGCVMSALLWYDLFAGTHKDMVFTINQYNTFIANRPSMVSNVP